MPRFDPSATKSLTGGQHDLASPFRPDVLLREIAVVKLANGSVEGHPFPAENLARATYFKSDFVLDEGIGKGTTPDFAQCHHPNSENHFVQNGD